MIFFRIINNFVKVNDVGMFQPLKHFQFLEYIHISILAFANQFAFKFLFIHLFHCKKLHVGILNQFDCSIGSFSKSFNNFVLIYHFIAIGFEGSNIRGAHYGRLSAFGASSDIFRGTNGGIIISEGQNPSQLNIQFLFNVRVCRICIAKIYWRFTILFILKNELLL